MPKNIVICCDGTGNRYGANPTNVLKLFERADKHSAKQVSFYDPGVGTSGAYPVVTFIGRAITKFLGLAFGYGLTRNIEDAYRYLMEHFEQEDSVYIFGFSRGAFTARALAGMLCKVGLLYRGRVNLVSYATEMYRFGKPEIAEGFKSTFAQDCYPHFVGVWDTVKAVGLIFPRKFQKPTLNEKIDFGYHALAIDEKRWKFIPRLWHEPAAPNQIIEQVWFAGVHSDVGGWYKETGLSDIALNWMLQNAKNQGLAIAQDQIDKIHGNYEGQKHKSLVSSPFWLSLALLPWPPWWWLLWHGRKIPDGAKIHVSVQDRKRNVKAYEPRNIPKDAVFVN